MSPQTFQEVPHPAELHEVCPPVVIPSWAFWISLTDTRTGISRTTIQVSKYLAFLASAGYRIFYRRKEPVVVKETDTGMEMLSSRGRIYPDIKRFVIYQLETAGFPSVGDYLAVSNIYFNLDVLEMLPTVDAEKAKSSLFSEVETDIYFDTPVEEETALITFRGEDWESVLLSDENFMGVSSHSGVGKSQFCELLASLALDGECEPHSPLHLNIPEGLIVWYDTERTTADCVRALKGVHARTEAWKAEKLSLLNDARNGFKRLIVKGLKGIDDQMTYILTHLDSLHEKVALVIADGVLDLVNSMNDEMQAKAFTTDLMVITKKLGCGVVVTVHANTSKDNSGSGMGHVGKAVERKSSAFLTIRREPNEEGRDIKRLTTDFNGGKVRHGRVTGVDAFYEFDEYDNLCHFIDPESFTKQSKTALRHEIEQTLDAVFDKQQTFNKKSEFYQAYSRVAGVSESTAKRHLGLAIKKWKLVIDDNGELRLDKHVF